MYPDILQSQTNYQVVTSGGWELLLIIIIIMVSLSDNRTTADKLCQEVRLFCVVMISEDSLRRSGRVITETWAGHCNNSMFMIERDVNKGRGSAVETFDYIYKHHYKDADWFLVVSDHTYVIVENLVYFLASQNHSEPVYFGYASLNLFCTQSIFYAYKMSTPCT